MNTGGAITRIECPLGNRKGRARANRRVIPAIAKSQNIFVGGHDVQHASADKPPTDRRLRTAIVLEARVFQVTLQRVIVGERYDLDDDVYIPSRTHW